MRSTFALALGAAVLAAETNAFDVKEQFTSVMTDLGVDFSDFKVTTRADARKKIAEHSERRIAKPSHEQRRRFNEAHHSLQAQR